MEFVKFPKIEKVERLWMAITQKLHGTNAQIYITTGLDRNYGETFRVMAGSRTRWLTKEDDNHGFAKWVHENQDELIAKLGVGRHFGEWVGKGINAGEGFPDKRLFLFDWHRWNRMPLPESVHSIPMLYTGKYSTEMIHEVMANLKANGSVACPGYMKPEGIVIEVGDRRYKRVFDDEEVQWSRPPGSERREAKINAFDASSYLQPLRLEKLLSRDEKYLREYPESLPQIVKDYIQDLQDEGCITGNEDEVAEKKKLMSRAIFNFVKGFPK